MNKLISIIIKIFFLLCFFISFAINIETWNWGMQMSWVFAFLIIILLGIIELKLTFPVNPVFTLLRFFLAFSFLDALLFWVGLIKPNIDSNYDIRRLIAHTCYIFIFLLICKSLYNFFREKSFQKIIVYQNYLTIYPFIIIGTYGTYQLLSTYNLVPYTDIFNNSLSTGFTYYRFVDDHRISSVFAEPSEYSYYLCFIIPILYRYIRSKKSNIIFKKIILSLLVVQIIFVKSLTFLIGFPIDILIIIIFIERLNIYKIIRLGLVALTGILGIVYISWDRIEKIISNEDGSVSDRTRDFLSTIDLFKNNIYSGFGYGGIRGMDGVSFLLASFGIIGTIIIFIIIYRILHRIFIYDKVISLSIFSMILSSLSSNNIFDYVFIWILLLYYYILSVKYQNINLK